MELLKGQFAQERDTYTRHAEREKENLSTIIAELQTNISEHEVCIVGLRSQCERSQEEAESLSQQIAELAPELQSKDDQLNTAALERNGRGECRDGGHVAESKLREMPGQRAEESRLALESVAEERDQLLIKVGAAQREVQDAQRQLLEERDALETARCQISEATTRNGELVSTVEEARSELSDVRSERCEMVERVRVEEERGRAVGEELTAKQAECSKLAKQLEHLKTHLMQVRIHADECIHHTHTHTHTHAHQCIYTQTHTHTCTLIHAAPKQFPFPH